jgi:hypothetical protein
MPWDSANVVYDEGDPPTPTLAFSQSDSRFEMTDVGGAGNSVTVLSVAERGPSDPLLYAEVRLQVGQDFNMAGFVGLDADAFQNFSMQPNEAGTATEITAGASGYGYQSANTIEIAHGEEIVLQYLFDFTLGRGWIGVNDQWFNWVSFDAPVSAPAEDQYFEFTPEEGTKIGMLVAPDSELTTDAPFFKLLGHSSQFTYDMPPGAIQWASGGA